MCTIGRPRLYLVNDLFGLSCVSAAYLLFAISSFQFYCSNRSLEIIICLLFLCFLFFLKIVTIIVINGSSLASSSYRAMGAKVLAHNIFFIF